MSSRARCWGCRARACSRAPTRAGSRAPRASPRDFRIETDGRELTLQGRVAADARRGRRAGWARWCWPRPSPRPRTASSRRSIDRLVSLGELSAYVAHEIRNPLTGIRTTVQFVGSKFKPRDPRREDLDDVIKELDRIEQIITGLLMFARPPAAPPAALRPAPGARASTLDMLELQLGDAAGRSSSRASWPTTCRWSSPTPT